MNGDGHKYDLEREEMLPFVPADSQRILEVGCATGRFGVVLRNAYPAASLWGIDPMPHPPDRKMTYDTRITGVYPDAVPSGERFDCVVFNDVLEHMVDPWSALLSTREILSPHGVVVASIPNVRNVVHVIRPLLVNGRWRYDTYGILDRTHLRFFTRSSIEEMFSGVGFVVDEIQPMNMEEAGRWAKLNRLLGGKLDDLLAVQFAVVASVAPNA